MPIQSCRQSVSAQRGKRCSEIGLLPPCLAVIFKHPAEAVANHPPHFPAVDPPVDSVQTSKYHTGMTKCLKL